MEGERGAAERTQAASAAAAAADDDGGDLRATREERRDARGEENRSPRKVSLHDNAAYTASLLLIDRGRRCAFILDL